MYMHAEVARHMHEERQRDAAMDRLVSQVRTLRRARRRLAGAERRMIRARVNATRLRREPEAEA